MAWSHENKCPAPPWECAGLDPGRIRGFAKLKSQTGINFGVFCSFLGDFFCPDLQLLRVQSFSADAAVPSQRQILLGSAQKSSGESSATPGFSQFWEVGKIGVILLSFTIHSPLSHRDSWPGRSSGVFSSVLQSSAGWGSLSCSLESWN